MRVTTLTMEITDYENVLKRYYRVAIGMIQSLNMDKTCQSQD